MSSTHVPDAVRAITEQTFPASVPAPLVDEILGSGRRLEIGRGENMVTNHKKPGITIVLEGLIRVFLRSPEGRQVTVRYARPGEALGLVHFLRAELEVHAQPGKCLLYDGCPAGGQVELCTFTGMDHCWAGGAADANGDACPEYADATELQWSFFETYAW